MTDGARKRELGRGERVLPGLWRLRLPLPWPGVPHCNAWAIAAGDGIVLVDTGMHEPGSFEHLQRALDMAGLRVESVRLVVCTHAHADHYGQAATVVQRAGCELWMHPDHAHMTQTAADPDAALERRIEVARTSGVPAAALQAIRERRRGEGFGVAGVVTPHRDLVDGVQVDTDLGAWQVVETPGHAPSHVSLWQPERRLLISGDHVLGRVSLYFDYGWSPDPVGEFLASLDRVAALDARLGLAGHGRTFTDVQGHVVASRRMADERLARVREVVVRHGAISAFDVVGHVYDEPVTAGTAHWWISETLAYLRHLGARGDLARDDGPDGVELWRGTERP